MKTRHIPGAATLTAVLSLCATACSEGPSVPGYQPAQLQTSARLEVARGASGGPTTLQWNAEAITLAGRHLLRAPVANRAYMLLSVAEARSLDALANATGESDDADNGVASRVGALGGAAVAVLTYVFPTDQPELDAMLAALRSTAPNAAHFDAAVALGREVPAAELTRDLAKSALARLKALAG